MAFNITILNHCFFTSSHLKRLRRMGQITIYRDTDSKEKAIRRLRDAVVAVANGLFAPLTKEVLEKTNNLKLLIVNSTGFDFVDMKTARALGIRVANVPGFSTEAVAEHVFALALAVMRKIPISDREARRVHFEINPAEKNSELFLGNTLHDKMLGLIGLGAIGKRVAEIGRAFGMDIIAYNRTKKRVPCIKMAPLKEVLQKSDVISLHLALVPETKNIISKKELNLLKPNSIIINTARGGLIDTKALVSALKSKRIAGAGLDVIAGVAGNRSLLKLDNVVLSPHSGWWTQESLEKQAEIIVQNIEAFVKGKPINIV